MPTQTLCGLRILVVEDEYLLAADLREMLAGAGATVVGPVATVEEALTLCDADEPPVLAVLDIDLDGRSVFPLADALYRHGTRFVFATGYGRADIPHRFHDMPYLAKPLDPEAVLATLGSLSRR